MIIRSKLQMKDSTGKTTNENITTTLSAEIMQHYVHLLYAKVIFCTFKESWTLFLYDCPKQEL